jgi:RNA polymerase sigma factor (sigma-70 family)
MDEAAEVGEAYRRLGHLVRQRCRRILRDDEIAEDAVQNAFVRLWRFLPAYRAASLKLPWMYRVADRCCFDLLARKRSRREQPITTAIGGSGESSAQALEDRELVLAFLERFDEEVQQIAVLLYLDEMSQGEIAESLGCSRQTVNKKIAFLRERALALRAAFAEGRAA